MRQRLRQGPSWFRGFFAFQPGGYPFHNLSFFVGDHLTRKSSERWQKEPFDSIGGSYATLLSCVIEARESRAARLSTRKATEPCHTSNDIESSSRGNVLQMRFLLPDRAGTT